MIIKALAVHIWLTFRLLIPRLIGRPAARQVLSMLNVLNCFVNGFSAGHDWRFVIVAQPNERGSLFMFFYIQQPVGLVFVAGVLGGLF